MTLLGSRWVRRAAGGVVLLAAVSWPSSQAIAQVTYTKGQTVAPAFEGWEENPDGSFNFVFGYLNRNWVEEPNVPAGPENSFSIGGADQGQPTHFLPGRNRFAFKVRVPADWGDKELAWTLTTHGQTEVAYASLRLDYILDYMVVASETGALGPGSSSDASRANAPPVVSVEGAPVRNVRVGEVLTLVTQVEDDGLPRSRPRAEPKPDDPILSPRALRPPGRITVAKVPGLHLGWYVYRGAGEVSFDPPQVKSWEDTRAAANSPWAPLWAAPPVPEGGIYTVQVTFSEPGTYVLRAHADDGGLYHDQEVTVVVSGLAGRDPSS